MYCGNEVVRVILRHKTVLAMSGPAWPWFVISGIGGEGTVSGVTGTTSDIRREVQKVLESKQKDDKPYVDLPLDDAFLSDKEGSEQIAYE